MPGLLEVRGLTKHFPIRGGILGRVTGHVHAVDDVDLTVGEGETVGLVGESGSGKSTLGRCILRLIEPSRGTVRFEGTDILSLDARSMRATRRRMQIIFQDPYTSLNPRMRIESIVGEPFDIHRTARGPERRRKIAELLTMVGLEESAMTKYPHEFSGGQRQRIGIARALAVQPRFLIADEPVSSLDVSIQAQILNLMVDLRERMKMAYLFIAHDLRIIEHIADRTAVMYLGQIVESAPTRALFETPYHPYTQALMAAIPVIDPATRRRRTIVAGDVPSPASPPPGCRFHTRCPVVEERCRREEPPPIDLGGGHVVACHLARPGSPPPALPDPGRFGTSRPS